MKSASASSTKPKGSVSNQSSQQQTNGPAVVVAHALTAEERAYRDAVIPSLLVRAYHLPGNKSWLQDWYQYMTNNHPIIGICLHHKYHPVQRNMRIFFLLGSVLFGLALTNIIYLAFVFSDTDYDKGYVEIKVNATSTGTPAIDNNVSALSVTNGNIALWTIGSALHALFDNIIWALAACTCCMEGGRGLTEQKLARYRSTGVFFVVLAVVVVTALATLAVALRAALTSGDADGTATKVNVTDTRRYGNTNHQQPPQTLDSYGLQDDQVQLFQVDGANDFEFIIAYLIELVLNYFFYYFVVGTLLFSGMLTCGRYPVVGGRPYELREAAAALSSMEEGHEVVWAATTTPTGTKKGNASTNLPASSTHSMSKTSGHKS